MLKKSFITIAPVRWVFVVFMLVLIYSGGYATHKFGLFLPIISKLSGILKLTPEQPLLTAAEIEEEAMAVKDAINRNKLQSGILQREQLKRLLLNGSVTAEILSPSALKTFLANKKIPANVNVYLANNYTIPSYAILHSENTARKCLIVNSRGHDASSREMGDAYTDILANNVNKCDLLTIDMIGRGFNREIASFPNNKQTIRIAAGSEHILFSMYYDELKPTLLPTSLFLSGNVAVVKKVIDDRKYERVLLIGESGGGWQALFMAAILPEINSTITVAGHTPFILKKFRKNTGDYEQVADPVYRQFSYWDLYVLSTVDAHGEFTRKHQTVYNSNDPCCFDASAGKIISEILSKTPITNFYVQNHLAFHHGISNELLGLFRESF